MPSARARERLRQERETFDQRKSQVRQWSRLRLWMGYSGIAVMALIAAIATIIILHPGQYGDAAVTGAILALIGDLLLLATTVYKLVLSPGCAQELAPVIHDPD